MDIRLSGLNQPTRPQEFQDMRRTPVGLFASNDTVRIQDSEKQIFPPMNKPSDSPGSERARIVQKTEMDPGQTIPDMNDSVKKSKPHEPACFTGKAPENELTALHRAVKSSDHETVLRIINQTPSAILAQDKDGNTPVHLAVALGVTSCLYPMLDSEKGREALSVKNHDNQYPLCLLFTGSAPPLPAPGLQHSREDGPLADHYPSHLTSEADKHWYDAEFSKSTLEDPGNTQLINAVARVILQMIRTVPNDGFVPTKSRLSIFSDFFRLLTTTKAPVEKLLSIFAGIFTFSGNSNSANDVYDKTAEHLTKSIDLGIFPTSKLIDHSNQDELFKTIKKLTEDNENHIVDIMTVIWYSVGGLLRNSDPQTADEIHNCYSWFSEVGRYHVVSESWFDSFNHTHSSVPAGKLGEAQVESSLYNNLNPLKTLSRFFNLEDYRHETKTDRDHLFYRYNRYRIGMPYLAGMSGMCNCFYSIYPLLNIDYDSVTGRRLRNIMMAFTVGLRFHSLKECSDAFAITHAYVGRSKELSEDFPLKGIFKSLDDWDLETRGKIIKKILINRKINPGSSGDHKLELP